MDADWDAICHAIEKTCPSLVIIDSLTHFGNGSMQGIKEVGSIMQKIRALQRLFSTTIAIVHHTTKCDDQPLNVKHMAGSRIISQESDFIIGINRFSNGVRYLKDIAYRYHQGNDDMVLKFNINDKCFVEPDGYFIERELLKQEASPKQIYSDEIVLAFMVDHATNNKCPVVEHSELIAELVESRRLSRVTLHKSLGRLQEIGRVKKDARGKYSLCA